VTSGDSKLARCYSARFTPVWTNVRRRARQSGAYRRRARNLGGRGPVCVSMTRSLPLRLVLATVLLAALGAATAQATATLTGPSTLRIQRNTQYTAHGLQSGRYHLMVRKRLTHGGRSYRCVAYLAAPRQASGTETFKGTLPTALQCTPASGAGASWKPRPPAGSYSAVACVAAPGAPAGTPAYSCDPRHSVATRSVRVVR
jgi:hypothetical protein